MANRPTPVKRPEIRRPTPTQRPAPGMTAPRFDSFFELQDNPLDAVAYPGDVEGNATAEINAALAAIRAEKRQGGTLFARW